MGNRIFFLLFWLVGSIILAFTLIPLVNLFLTQPLSSIVNVAGMQDVRASIYLSMITAVITALLAAILGTPLAYLLARRSFPHQAVIEAIVDLPLAVPHTVAGISLLFIFGRNGPIGRIAQHFGLSFWGSSLGIIIGMLFVSSPYMINAAREGFESIDIRLEKAARTLGATPRQVFLHVSLPLSLRSILTGIVLTYARSIAEFGAVIVMAYYPQTAPVKIYELFLSGGIEQAAAAAALLLLITLSTFVLFRYFAYKPRLKQYHKN
ncbi:ABC transporter permease [Desulfosporosinus sp. FKB]|uniref:ABC transporter permease n=1 Tax=Desulfosporosinus sp. FKB TaxID=1969835 RepID=UPI000B4A1E0B|nr:ABC transporter permease [Desulfosporosinus sp. FKB]